MANRALTADVIATAALATLDNELGWLNQIHRAHEEEFSNTVNGYKVGDTISIRRPHDPRPRTGATMDVKDVIEGKVPLVINKQVGHDFQFTSSDLSLKIEDLSERVLKPAVINIVNEIARDVAATMYGSFYNWVGTPTSTINSFADFALGPKRLDEMAVPQSDRVALMSPDDYWDFVGSQTALFINDAARSAYREGTLGKIGNVNTFMSQVTPSHTTGARTNAAGPGQTNGASQEVTYDTVKDTWTQSLSTNNHPTTWTWKAGDVFTLQGCYMVNPKTKQQTGILQQFVVLADISANATTASNTTLTISPPIIFSGPHQTVTLSGVASTDDLTITNIGTASTVYKQNMVFHKNAMTLAVVPLVMPEGAVNGSRKSHKGLSCRVIPVYDGTNDQNKWRLDILYGRTLQDPRLGARISGSA
jgi:hypothetical protein